MQDYKVKFLSFVALLAMAVAILPANAGGKVITVQVPVNAEVLTADAEGYATTTFGWTSSGIYAALDEALVNVVWSNGVASSTTSVVKACTPATTTAFGALGSYTTLGSGTATWRWTAPTGGAMWGQLCLRVPVTSDLAGTIPAKNFSIAVLTTGSNVDYGAVMFYANGGDDVFIDATIPPTLSFSVVSSTSLTTEKHVCELGNASGLVVSGSVFTCDYRLKISTNASNGLSITQTADKDLSTASYATITKTGVSTVVTTAAEAYGFALGSATYGGRNVTTGLFTSPITETAPYNVDDNPVPTSPTQILSYTSGFFGTSTNSTSLVTHRIAVSAATPAGYYTQTVTYRATGSF